MPNRSPFFTESVAAGMGRGLEEFLADREVARQRKLLEDTTMQDRARRAAFEDEDRTFVSGERQRIGSERARAERVSTALLQELAQLKAAHAAATDPREKARIANEYNARAKGGLPEPAKPINVAPGASLYDPDSLSEDAKPLFTAPAAPPRDPQSIDAAILSAHRAGDQAAVAQLMALKRRSSEASREPSEPKAPKNNDNPRLPAGVQQWLARLPGESYAPDYDAAFGIVRGTLPKLLQEHPGLDTRAVVDMLKTVYQHKEPKEATGLDRLLAESDDDAAPTAQTAAGPANSGLKERAAAELTKRGKAVTPEAIAYVIQQGLVK